MNFRQQHYYFNRLWAKIAHLRIKFDTSHSFAKKKLLLLLFHSLRRYYRSVLFVKNFAIFRPFLNAVPIMSDVKNDEHQWLDPLGSASEYYVEWRFRILLRRAKECAIAVLEDPPIRPVAPVELSEDADASEVIEYNRLTERFNSDLAEYKENSKIYEKANGKAMDIIVNHLAPYAYNYRR